jgi:small-conductance mechanosensitive channel
MDSSSVFGRVVDAFVDGANMNEVFVQVAVAVAAIALAYVVAHAMCARITLKRWQFGKGSFEPVATPLLAIALVWIAKHLLARFQDNDGGPMELILSLLVTWAFIRASVYVLGHVIPDGGLQRALIRLVTWGAWIVVVLHLTGVLPDFLAALDSHGITLGKNEREITLLNVAKAVVTLFFAVIFALWISRVTEGRVMGVESMDFTTRVVITKIAKVTIIVVAIFVALPFAGIDVTTLSIFSGAVGVGLGFGLQKIASNYVSGFIVLLDRSLRIGDVVTVDGRRGEVKAIRSRFTVIKGSDGVESIIPNEKLITDSVNHHTYSDPKVSMVINAAISYGSDADRACELMVAAAKKQRRVVADPPIAARVKSLGADGVELELTVWIQDPAMGDGDVRSEVLKELLKSFKAGNIELARARREVHLIATGETQNSPVKTIG